MSATEQIEEISISPSQVMLLLCIYTIIDIEKIKAKVRDTMSFHGDLSFLKKHNLVDVGDFKYNITLKGHKYINSILTIKVKKVVTYTEELVSTDTCI